MALETQKKLNFYVKAIKRCIDFSASVRKSLRNQSLYFSKGTSRRLTIIKFGTNREITIQILRKKSEKRKFIIYTYSHLARFFIIKFLRLVTQTLKTRRSPVFLAKSFQELSSFTDDHHWKFDTLNYI